MHDFGLIFPESRTRKVTEFNILETHYYCSCAVSSVPESAGSRPGDCGGSGEGPGTPRADGEETVGVETEPSDSSCFDHLEKIFVE